jgi:hypothetical protein
MAAETEIERLIVRLVGDGSTFQQMMKDAEESSKRTAEAVEHNTKEVEKFGEGLKKVGENVVQTLEALGVEKYFEGAFEKAKELELNQIRLRAAIEGTGQSVAQIEPLYVKFASTMSHNSLASKGEVLQLLKMATAHGLNADAAQRATQNAMALAAATGSSAEHMIHATIGLEEGHTQLLRMIPGMRRIKDETELLAKAQRLITVGTKTMAAEVESAAGLIVHQEHAWSSFIKR